MSFKPVLDANVKNSDITSATGRKACVWLTEVHPLGELHSPAEMVFGYDFTSAQYNLEWMMPDFCYVSSNKKHCQGSAEAQGSGLAKEVQRQVAMLSLVIFWLVLLSNQGAWAQYKGFLCLMGQNDVDV